MTSQLVFSSLIILGNTFLSNSNSEVAASYMMLLSNNEYQCSVCEHRSKFKNNMIKHIDSKHIHHGPESCPFCQKQCSSKQALQKHISRYHRDLNDQFFFYNILQRNIYFLGLKACLSSRTNPGQRRETDYNKSSSKKESSEIAWEWKAVSFM